MLNLEPNAAEVAMTLVQKAKGAKRFALLPREAAQVVAEQGLFALGVFLATRNDDSASAMHIHNAINELLKRMDLVPAVNGSQLKAEYYRALVTTQQDEKEESDAVHRILLIQQVVEQMLNYATYYAKRPD